MSKLLSRILAARGIHYFVTRFGSKRLQKLSYDAKFASGDWVFSSESADLVRIVEGVSNRGHILALGCGSAAIASLLSFDSYASFHGVDLSEEAIALASSRKNAKATFQIGDMENHGFKRPYDVILFSNSINYIRPRLLGPVLRACGAHLTDNGRIVVSIAEPGRYADILAVIRRDFRISTDRPLESGHGHVIVFR